MLPQMMVSLGPSVALRGITQRPVLLLCGTVHCSDMLWSYRRSVLSLPVVSIVLLPACTHAPCEGADLPDQAYYIPSSALNPSCMALPHGLDMR